VKKLKPFQVPTTDGQKIFEHFGLASTNVGDFSLAHMCAPPGWTEAVQITEFDEFVVVVRGQLTLELNGTIITVDAGESIVAPKGLRVRYANTSMEEAEYIALCMPAFRLDRVRREEADTID